eukprot:NODE_3085_length_599_cov_864.069091_g2582_i0.p2 GENE.NODE_3085_length_599_cov_864.069091_g2582_i0~~NODE_3085_length_599_cov_864.069091_g2582_i0.p2  ORF type:complete len:103 (-),score=22.76 NODE_3085_length_599_cov_864.069091_g2582_i0:212-520(-)
MCFLGSNETCRSDDQAPKTEGDSQQISIKVVNAEGAEVYFKIKRSTPLRKLMDAYCKKQGINRTSVRFHFDGRRIEDEKTAEDYEMEDDDVIDAMVEQTGGY